MLFTKDKELISSWSSFSLPGSLQVSLRTAFRIIIQIYVHFMGVAFTVPCSLHTGFRSSLSAEVEINRGQWAQAFASIESIFPQN